MSTPQTVEEIDSWGGGGLKCLPWALCIMIILEGSVRQKTVAAVFLKLERCFKQIFEYQQNCCPTNRNKGPDYNIMQLDLSYDKSRTGLTELDMTNGCAIVHHPNGQFFFKCLAVFFAFLGRVGSYEVAWMKNIA